MDLLNYINTEIRGCKRDINESIGFGDRFGLLEYPGVDMQVNLAWLGYWYDMEEMLNN